MEKYKFTIALDGKDMEEKILTVSEGDMEGLTTGEKDAFIRHEFQSWIEKKVHTKIEKI